MRNHSFPIALCLALTVLLGATVVLRLQGGSPDRTPADDRLSVEGCIGVAWLSEPLLGLVCVSSTDQLLPAAVERLRLPPDCASLQLPSTLETGDLLLLRIEDGSCSLDSIGRLPGGARLLCGRGIDVNRDSVEDLVLLPGIGPVRAREIVAERERNGPFDGPDELQRVKGIGPGTVSRLKNWLE